MNETLESTLHFIVNINFFNGSNDLSNFLKRVNFILNVISIGMNDDQIKFLASRRSDVVYNIICGGTRMESDFDWIITKDLTPIISSVVAPGWNLILTESSLKTSRP